MSPDYDPNPIHRIPLEVTNPEQPKQKEEKYSPPPELIKTTHTNTYKKDDPPLIDLKITNPVTYLKKWWKRILGNEGIIFSFRIRPLTAILIAVTVAALVTGTGVGLGRFVFGVGLRQEVVYTGIVYQSNEGNYYLIINSYQGFSLKGNDDFRLSDYINKTVLIRGNLSKRESILEISEISAI